MLALIRYILYLVIIGSFFLIIPLLYLYQQTPDISSLDELKKNNLIQLYDNQNNIFKTYSDSGVDYIKYSKLPGHLISAVVAIEDRKFFNHRGIDFFSIPRAFFVNIKLGYYAQGASTISQQLAKLYFLSSEKTIKRKIKEILIAVKIEQEYSKQEIIEMYLNKAYFGSGNYGIVSASRDYFNKNVEDLNINESALLAGLLKAPSKYSPKINPDLSKQRTNLVLNRMYDIGFINDEELIVAQYEDNAWNNKFSTTDNYRYYADWVKSRSEKYINNFPYGVKIYTGYDSEINTIIEKIIAKYRKKYEILSKTQIAIIAMHLDGQILSVVGGYDYKQSQYNRAIYGKRQPGSAFKIFVYLEALRRGYEIDDKVTDSPKVIDGWIPKNYNNNYRGRIKLDEAFAYSVNTVAADIGYKLGIKNIIELAKKMGIESKIPEVPSIVLGTGEISLYEMVRAYAVIANGGYEVNPYIIDNIRDNYGNILYLNKKELNGQKILDSYVIDDISILLKQVVEIGTGRAAKIDGIDIRGKTGTSQEYRDAWFIGYSPDLVLGVWIGNDNEGQFKITGGTYPAMIFRDIMKGIYN